MSVSGVAVINEPVVEAMPSMSRDKLFAGALGFLGLTVGVFWWLFSRAPGGQSAPGLAGLRWGYFALILLVIPVETVAAGLRMWIVSRTLQPGVRFGTC